MDPRYESYFRSRLASQMDTGAFTIESAIGGPSVRADSEEAHDIVRSAIDAARTDLARSKRRLRPDAELLLYLSFSELVARPVIEVGRSTDDLREAVSDDVVRISRRAAELAEGGQDISAHRIIDATSGLWPDLRSGHWGIWD